MSHYLIDERDILFNLKECPGLEELQKLEGFSDTSEDTLHMIFEQAKNMCLKVWAPLLLSSDRVGCRLENGKMILPTGIQEAWNQYRELGFIGMNSSSEYGGGDLPHMFSMPVGELESGSFVSFSMLPLLTRGAARLILAFGNDTLKRTYVERMFVGEWSGTMCLTEPGAGSDVGAGITRAVPCGDSFKISGTKIFITWGEHELTDNIIHLVLARLPGAPAGTKGLSLFVVPKFLTNEEGEILEFNDVECVSIEHKLGINASPTCVLNFGPNDNCRGYLVGEANQGMRYMFQMMNDARLEVGVQGMAQASAAYLSALAYAKERTQGTVQTPSGPKVAKIIEHPDVRNMLLRMRALAEGSRSLLFHMAIYTDMATHHTELAAKYQGFVELLTPIAKSYCSDQGFRVAELGVQVHGGYGFTKEYPAEQYLRDIKIASIYEGTNGIQALDLVFRKILSNKGENLRIYGGELLNFASRLSDSPFAEQGKMLEQAIAAIQKAVQHFSTRVTAGQTESVQFHATSFQEYMGHTVVAYCLLRQAKTAWKKLAVGASTEDRHFYEQKMITAKFFCEAYLVQAVAGLELITKSQDYGLEATWN